MPLKTSQDDMPTINLTPMLDVVFNLIVFFMVATRFSDLEQSVDLKVPSVGATAGLRTTPERSVINVYRDGRLALDLQPVTLDQLKGRLASARLQNENLDVVIRGDEQVAFLHVAAVLTECRLAGVSEMGISVIMTKERLR